MRKVSFWQDLIESAVPCRFYVVYRESVRHAKDNGPWYM